MFLNKIKLSLLISICLLFFFLTYNDVKSDEIKIVSGLAIVTDGDSLKIDNNKIRLVGIDAPELKQTCQNGVTTCQNGSEGGCLKDVVLPCLIV